MDVVKFNAFRTVASLKNISKAAEQLHYTQPAVSAQIRELENIYGSPLFQRVGHNLELTGAGLKLLPYAENVLELFEQSRRSVEEASDIETRCVRVGASSLPGTYLVPQLIGRFKRENPQFKVTLVVDDAVQIERMLVNGEVDAAIVGRSGIGYKKGRANEAKLLEDPLVAVVSPDHPFAERDSLQPEELNDQPLIMPPEGRLTRRSVEKRFRRLGLGFNLAYEHSDTEGIKRLVYNGLGISLLSRMVTLWEVSCGWLTTIPVEGFNVKRKIFMVYPQSRVVIPAVHSFIEFVSEVYEVE